MATLSLTRSLFISSALLVVAMLLACNGVLQTSPGTDLNVAITGSTVIKARSTGQHLVALQERLLSIFDDGPSRSLSVLQSDGSTLGSYVAPAGWSLLDFALHPSGDISVVLTTARQVRIVRLDPAANVRFDQLFLDAASPNDPFFDYAGGLKDDNALQPALMHDAARLTPLGEDLALVLRTGRNAIVAYRLDQRNSTYALSWRTLVEPGASILFIGITGGSFDTFGQLQNHIRLFVDADASASTLAVGVVNANHFNFTFRAHSDFFGEPISATSGMLLTRLSSTSGTRLGTTVVDSHQRSELHGLRATPTGFALVGRVLTSVRPDGTGWDAFFASVHSDGSLAAYNVIDVDRGDVLFDIAPLPSGRFLALGASGYTQNPFGESISESAQPLLALLNPDGSLAAHLPYPAGPRHNQLTTITPWMNGWLLGGMVNGPGTHSGDADHSLIVADGFLRALATPAGD